MRRYSPGQVAEQTGFSIDTLRYYERIGLLDDIERNSGGQRVFSEDDVSWLMILRCLRETGMPIQRMVRFAELARGGEATIPERVTVLEEHDRDIDEKITQLRAEQEHIRGKIEYYQGVLRDREASASRT
ncbi:MAG TPA: MerR family transcriptional regulator [Actinophytocola sp.]|jgi:DNA-binding transcriptional MerR regulator|nr:MerR family transcriptional regulator [Actinophytocola sp.]